MKAGRDDEAFRRLYDSFDETSRARFRYCYQIGSTFIHVNLMEDSVISAMATCDRIQLAKVLGSDAKRWEEFASKFETLRDSTLGNLIQILSRHSIQPDDLRYLRWLKAKRDFFIHRFFHRGEWPGELDADQCEIMIRRLLYLEIVFNRASRRIWKIFGRAQLMILQDLGAAGMLMMNHGLFEDPR